MNIEEQRAREAIRRLRKCADESPSLARETLDLLDIAEALEAVLDVATTPPDPRHWSGT